QDPTPEVLENREAPGVNREAPGVNREAPGVNREAPGVNREAPGVNREAPGVNREAPGVNREALLQLLEIGSGSMKNPPQQIFLTLPVRAASMPSPSPTDEIMETSNAR